MAKPGRKKKSEMFPRLIMGYLKEDYIRFLCREHLNKAPGEPADGLLVDLLVDWFLCNVKPRKPSGKEIAQIVDQLAVVCGSISFATKVAEYELNTDTGVKYVGAGTYSEEQIQKAHTRYGRRKPEIDTIREVRRAYER